MKKPTGRFLGQDIVGGEANFIPVRSGKKLHAAHKNKPPKAPKVGLTWLGDRNKLDEASRKILESGRKIKGGLSYNTQGWVQEKIAEGDIEGGMASGHTGTSIFDPVLCELAYRWFCPPDGTVLDPFAGGSVRGIVASVLGRKYFGVDLSEAQVAANRAQLAIATGPEPVWIVADAKDIDDADIGICDMIFTCPPYGDLEVYSEDPRDLSTMDANAFFLAYKRIIKAACSKLKDDRFAVIVVGDYRDKQGYYRNLPGETVDAFEKAGLHLYNEAILVTAAGSLPIRAREQFTTSRKLGKTHQNVLVFVKGDPKKATLAVGPVDFGVGEPEPDEDTPEAEPEPVVSRWKVSAAWAAKQHDCTAHGVMMRCGGACCRSPSFWPPKAYAGPDNPGHKCGHLGDTGCTLAPEDKPVTCHLYPMMLNDNGTLILHQRATFPKGVCHGNFGNGPPLIESIRPNLIKLFGEEQVDRVTADVMAGRDSYFEPGPEVLAAYKQEKAWEATNLPPLPRSAVHGPSAGVLTPIEAHGELFLKRDDLFEVAGVRGGKVRTCWNLAQGATGLVTAGARSSPQINIVAHIAERLGIPCRAHAPQGKLGLELEDAKLHGAEIVQHTAGYNSVIVARAKADAKETGWREIPFGMECQEAVTQTRGQVRDIPDIVKRIVVPVGSGMSLAGILWGLVDQGIDMPVLGVVVGADPTKRLDKFAPLDWRDRVVMVKAGQPYDHKVVASIGGVVLDPIYEAKCAGRLTAGDMLWIVGVRAT